MCGFSFFERFLPIPCSYSNFTNLNGIRATECLSGGVVVTLG